MIKVILCDADGMLIKGEMFSVYLAKKYGITTDKTLPFFTGEFQDCLIGKTDLKKVVKKYLESWGWKKSVDDLLKEWFRFEDNIDEKLANHLNLLRKKGIRVYLTTNQEKYRTQYMLDEMGFGKILDGVFSSAYLGYKKPNKEFFEKVMSKLQNVKKSEVLFWDDQQENVNGARRFGFKAELYTNLEDFEDKIKKYIQHCLHQAKTG